MAARPAVVGAWLEPPEQQTFDLGAVGSGLRITSLRREDLQTSRIQELGSIHFDGFGGKKCCLCCGESEAEMQKAVFEGFSQAPDSKFEACGVALGADGQVLGFAQLGFHDTPGDVAMPLAFRETPPLGTCHLERIVTSPKVRGKGLGSKLLDWVDSKAREKDCKFVVLEVVNGNPAKKLYEKHGYVQQNGCCSKCCMCPWVCCLMGYLYLDKMRKIL
mmetsp:Transcript_120223/g.335419  ORF Transcript_120223/g.335419 Transcript_120223/m.335419 type:complete len:218 (+) Transcript_120223:93-746(+)